MLNNGSNVFTKKRMLIPLPFEEKNVFTKKVHTTEYIRFHDIQLNVIRLTMYINYLILWSVQDNANKGV